MVGINRAYDFMYRSYVDYLVYTATSIVSKGGEQGPEVARLDLLCDSTGSPYCRNAEGDGAFVVFSWYFTIYTLDLLSLLEYGIKMFSTLFAKAKKRGTKLPEKWSSLEELEALTGIKLPSLEEIKVKVKGAPKYTPEPEAEKSEIEEAGLSPRILKVRDKLRIALYSNYLPEPVVRGGPAGKKGGSPTSKVVPAIKDPKKSRGMENAFAFNAS